MKKLLDINESKYLPVLIIYIIGIILYPYFFNLKLVYYLLFIGVSLSSIYFLPCNPRIKYLLRYIFIVGIYMVFYSVAQLNVDLQERHKLHIDNISEGKSIILFQLNDPHIFSEESQNEGFYYCLNISDTIASKEISTQKRYKDISKCISVYNQKMPKDEQIGKLVLQPNFVDNQFERFNNINSKIITYLNINSRIRKTINNDIFSDADIYQKLNNYSFSHKDIYLKKGDIVLSVGEIRKIKNKGNPEEFDYAGYMKKNEVEYMFYADTIIHTGVNAINQLDKRIYDFRNKLKHAIENISEDNINIGFIKAITIGDKSEIEDDTKQAFSKSGLSHILALSGLHTGIIYIIIMYLLMPIAILRGRVVRLLLAAVIIILFCMISGFSASVIRASVMILFLILTKIFYINYSKYNILFLTAFIMLFFNPKYIYDVGFQLSFMAMLSIFIYYPLIEKLYINQPINVKKNEKITFLMRFFSWKNRHFALKLDNMLKSLLSIINISISAQILTLPISIYYFNIFPISFLLSNILVIPLMLPLMILLISYLTVYIVLGFNIKILAVVIDMIVSFINKIAGYFSSSLSLKHAENIFYDKYELIMIIILIIIISKFLLNQKFKDLFYGLSLLIFIITYNIVSYQPNFKMFIPNNFNNTTLHIFNNKTKTEYLISNDTVFDYKRLDAIDGRIRRKNDIKNVEYINEETYDNEYVLKDRNIIIADGKSFIFIDKEFNNKYSKIPLKIDYPIIKRGFTGSISQINRLVEYKEIIISSSLSDFYRKRLLSESDSLNIPIFDIKNRGAFVIF